MNIRPLVYTAGAVFTAGFCVMGVEILASRLVAPALGNSVLIWTNLIGVILLCLATGAWLGGLLADRFPHASILGWLLLVTGIACLPLNQTTSLGLKLASTMPETYAIPLLALAVLALPALLLGAVPPIATRLAMRDVTKAGSIAGILSAIGTLGSLLGTYVTGYILIAHWPTDRIVYILAGILIVFGALLLITSRHAMPAIAVGMAAVALAPGIPVDASHQERTIPSQYASVRVTDQTIGSTPSRLLWMDNVLHAASDLTRTDRSITAYNRAAQTLMNELRPEAKRLLAVGGGAFHTTREWIAVTSDRSATVIERDPAVIDAARSQFGLVNDARHRVIESDGRIALRGLAETFDIVYIDAFADKLTIPWHLVTQEAWNELSSHLTKDGLVAMNVILQKIGDTPANARAMASIANAAMPHFDWMKLIRLYDPWADGGTLTNGVLLFGRGTEPSDASINKILTDAGVTNGTPVIALNRNAFPALTDRYAPLEFLSLDIMN
jgi:predicted membrane-bound spermidine synthase